MYGLSGFLGTLHHIHIVNQVLKTIACGAMCNIFQIKKGLKPLYTNKSLIDLLSRTGQCACSKIACSHNQSLGRKSCILLFSFIFSASASLIPKFSCSSFIFSVNTSQFWFFWHYRNPMSHPSCTSEGFSISISSIFSISNFKAARTEYMHRNWNKKEIKR